MKKLLCILLLPATVSFGETGFNAVIDSLSFNNVPMSDAARLITAQSGVTVICTPDAGKTPISIYIRENSLETALQLLCRTHSLRLNITDGKTATVSTIEEFSRSFHFYEEETVETVTVQYPSVLDVGDALKALFRDRLVWERPDDEFGDPTDNLERALERMDILTERSQFGLNNLNSGSSSSSSSSRSRSSNSRSNSSNSRSSSRSRGSQNSDPSLQQLTRLEQTQSQLLQRSILQDRMAMMESLATTPEVEKPDGTRKSDAALVFLSALPEVNTLMIRSTDKAAIARVKMAVKEIDKPRSQVLLKVSILAVTHTKGETLGVNWLFGRSQASGGITSGEILPPSGTLFPQGTGFDANSFVLNYISDHFRMRLQALAKDEDIREVASPTMLVADNEFSTVFVGKQGQFLDQLVPGESIVSDSGIVTTETTATLTERNIGLSLVISPRVHADRSITLRIMQERSTTDEENKRSIVIGSDGSTQKKIEVQDIDQQTVSSTLVAKDGSLVILGGLIRDKKQQIETGIPILKDIPLLGYFFRNTETVNAREELIVLISPTVMLSPGEEHLATGTLLQELNVSIPQLGEHDGQPE